MVYPGFIANNTQVQAFAFGNPNLAPETAESFTYGLVFQPDWFPVGDFRATVDWYDIEITDVIASWLGTVFPERLLPELESRELRSYRSYVNHGPSFLGQHDAWESGLYSTDGVDIQLEWSVQIGPGEFTVNELYSITNNISFGRRKRRWLLKCGGRWRFA